ncbi:TldD/PmbA family protein [Candidatus Woesearchaeota archaeon]|nr:TldD/PmbA family protein [Candidatus Woesearchaeota archaeon]
MEDLADYAIELASRKGAAFADARYEKKLYNGFLLKNGIVQSSAFEEFEGIGVRVNINGTVGFACTNTLSRIGIKKAVEFAIRDSKAISGLNNGVFLRKSSPAISKYSVKEKIKIEEVGSDQHITCLFDIEKALLSTGVKVPFRYLYLSDSVDEKYYCNSEGSKVTSIVPRVNFYYFITIASRGKTAQRYWQYGKAGGFEAVTEFGFPETLSNDVLSMKKNIEHAVKPPREKTDVIVAPQITGIMVHESGGHPYEADRILGREAAQAGESFITPDLVRSRIGSDAVNISDDPTIPNSFGFYLYDDEGVKAQRKQLVKNGIISNFLHNRETASVFNIDSNASGRTTGFDREPIVRMSNTFIEPGDQTEEELIEDVKKGVYIKTFTEWNIDDKRENQKYVGAEAYMIEEGRILGPVSKPTIEITTNALYSSIDAVANNTEYHAGTCGKGEPMQALPVWFGGPSMRIRGIRLR